HAESVANRDARRNQEKVVGEADIVPILSTIEIMVSDERTHDDGLARTRRHLECNAWKIVFRRSGNFPCFFKLSKNVLADVRFLGDFVEPNRGLNRFALGEEEGLCGIASRIEEPKIKQLTCDARRLRIFSLPPYAHLAAEQIDDMIAMLGRGHFVKPHQLALRALTNGNRLDFRPEDAASLDRTRIIQFTLWVRGVMPFRLFVGIV